MGITGGQGLIRIDTHTEIGHLILDMTKAMGHAGRNNHHVSWFDCLHLAVHYGTTATGTNQHQHGAVISRKFPRIGTFAPGFGSDITATIASTDSECAEAVIKIERLG